jgi:hypothetical protein
MLHIQTVVLGLPPKLLGRGIMVTGMTRMDRKNNTASAAKTVAFRVCVDVSQNVTNIICHSSNIVTVNPYTAHTLQAFRTIQPTVSVHLQTDLHDQAIYTETTENTAVISRKYRRITQC